MYPRKVIRDDLEWLALRRGRYTRQHKGHGLVVQRIHQAPRDEKPYKVLVDGVEVARKWDVTYAMREAVRLAEERTPAPEPIIVRPGVVGPPIPRPKPALTFTISGDIPGDCAATAMGLLQRALNVLRQQANCEVSVTLPGVLR